MLPITKKMICNYNTPFMLKLLSAYHNNKFYHCHSNTEALFVACDETLNELSVAEPVLVYTPEYDWEKKNCDGVHFPFINEGPFGYKIDGNFYILYSASGSWANNYYIGILRFVGGDPLDKNNWQKQSFPALCSEDGWNGPGHCTAFLVEDTNFIAFHNYDEGKTKGWNNVHAVVLPFE